MFGLELGKSFTIPQCRLFKIAKRSFDYEGTDQVLCYRRFYDDVQSGPAKTVPEGIVTLNYPPTQLPALTLGVTARLITGDLEAVYILTPGALYSKENLEVLTAKYGSPTLSQSGSPSRRSKRSQRVGVSPISASRSAASSLAPIPD